MTTSLMASAAGKILDGGVTVKNCLATTSSSATADTTNSNNTQQ
jgi:hypothetical protein